MLLRCSEPNFPWSFNTQVLLNLPPPFPLMHPNSHHHFVLMHYINNNKKKKTLDEICLRAFPTISGSPSSRWPLQAFCLHTSIQKVINKCSWITLPFIKHSLWIVLGQGFYAQFIDEETGNFFPRENSWGIHWKIIFIENFPCVRDYLNVF